MSASQADDWTEDQYIQLIREYRARPILWDPLDPLFYKRNIQPAAWDDIAHVLNIEPEECKRKMNVILWRFKREKTKLIKIIQNESDEPVRKYTSNWFAFKEMAFMLDKDTERKRQSKGLTIEDDGEIPSIKMTLLKRKIQPPIRTKTTEITMATPNIPLKIIKKEADDFEAAASTSRSLSDSDEEVKSFTTFIGNKMKKYTDVTKTAVQQAICDIIFQADQNYYESKIIPIIEKELFQTLPFDTDLHEEIKKENSFSDSE